MRYGVGRPQSAYSLLFSDLIYEPPEETCVSGVFGSYRTMRSGNVENGQIHIPLVTLFQTTLVDWGGGDRKVEKLLCVVPFYTRLVTGDTLGRARKVSPQLFQVACHQLRIGE